MNKSIPVFFYGGLINPLMLQSLGVPDRLRDPATLSGFNISISPWVNIEPDESGQVFGVVMEMTQQELDDIYQKLRIRYSPISVTVNQAGADRVVTCYVAGEDLAPGQADEAHVRMLLEAAEHCRFPEWYLERIRSYLPR